ncbi:MAG: TlpA disulfide reductase family protein [Endomicrobiia bacterium]
MKIKKILLNVVMGTYIFTTSNIFAQPKKYTDFTLQNLKGENVKLSDLVGEKVILLNFWTTWCPYCVREIPELKKYYSEYKEKGLEILAINIQEAPNQVKNFVSKRNIDYPILLDRDGSVAQQYGVRGIPTNYLISKDGVIIFSGHQLPLEEYIQRSLLPAATRQPPSLPKRKKK